MVAIRSAERHLFDSLVDDQSVRLVVHDPQSVARNVQEAFHKLASTILVGEIEEKKMNEEGWVENNCLLNLLQYSLKKIF